MIPTFMDFPSEPFGVLVAEDEVIRPMVLWAQYLDGYVERVRNTKTEEYFWSFSFFDQKSMDMFMEGCFVNMQN